MPYPTIVDLDDGDGGVIVLKRSETQSHSVAFRWGLASADGAWYEVHSLGLLTGERAKIRSYLRSQYDIVSLRFRKEWD